MHWIYLSPHFDDIALSCGGLAWEQCHAGDQVEIWTVCAGDAPVTRLSPFAQELHDRWQTGPEAVAERLNEDIQATHILGATSRYFEWPDCIYRFRPEDGAPVITGEYDLFHAEPEPGVVNDLTAILKKTVPNDACLISPMALGNHVDHHLTRQAAEASGLPLWFYADYPYILNLPAVLEKMERADRDLESHRARDLPATGPVDSPDLAKTWARLPAAISLPALKAWQASIAAYRSQISTFWKGLSDMEMAIQNYWAGGGGRLWRINET